MIKFFSYSYYPSLAILALLGCVSPVVSLADDIDDIEKAEALLLEEEAKAKAVFNNNAAAPKKVETAPVKRNVAPAPVRKVAPLQEIASLKNQIDLQGRTNRKIKTENEILREQLAKSQAQVKELMAKVAKLRNELMIAETEVERLSLVSRGDSRSKAYNKPTPSRSQVAAFKRPDPLLTDEQTQKASEEMPIATVLVDKANLRAGPGLANSPIMSVTKGTRLAVETRSGDWYRVVAPTGERAWISSDTVAFGRDSRSAPSRTVREQSNKNFDEEEEQAMELIRKANGE